MAVFIMTTSYFHIGKIVAVYGLQGEMVLLHEIKKKEPLKGVKAIFIENKENSFIPYFIKNLRRKNTGELYLQLEDLNTKEAAESLLKKPVYLDEEHFRLQINKDSPLYYLGFQMKDYREGVLGVISEVIQMPEQLLTKIYQGENELLIPLNDQTLKKVDHKNHIIHVDLPEGLLDIYRS